MALFETPVSAAIKGTIEGTFGLAGKVVEAAGNAARGVGEALGGALEGAMSPAPVTVVNNVGMAGEAGKSKVSGAGTLPAAPKKSARPAVNPNMPTEKLLVVAVNYLSSIEKTLTQQLQFERVAAQQQAQAEKENAIEGSKSGAKPFSDLGEKLGIIKDNAKQRASSAGKLLLGAGLLGAVGLAGLGKLDTKDLEELKSNWSALMDKLDPVFKIIDGLRNAVGDTAFLGMLAGSRLGWRGALIGLIGGKLFEQAEGTYNPDTGRMEGGEGWTSTLIKNVPAIALAVAPISTIKYAWSGIKAAGAVVSGFVKRQAARFTAWAADRLFARMIFMTIGKGRMWNLFVRFLEKKAARVLLERLATLATVEVAATAVEAGVAATGVGVPVAAVMAIVEKLIAAGFAAWLLWDMYQFFQEFWNTPEAQAQAATEEEKSRTRSAASTAGATATTTNRGSGVIPGAPRASAEEAQNLPAIPADVEKILATIRTRESGGNYGAQNPSSSASGAYQFIDSSWQALTAQYGIGTEYAKAKLAPPEIQDAVAAKYVQEILQESGGDVSKVPVKWFTGNIRGDSNVVSRDEVAKYQSAWMNTYTGGQYSGSSYDLQGDNGSISGLASSLWNMTKGAVEALAGIAGAGFGPMESRGLTDSLMKGSINTTPTPHQNLSAQIPGTPAGGGAQAAAISTTDSKASEIAQASAKIQSAIDMGASKANEGTTMTNESAGQTSLRKASSDSKLEGIDPNYPGTGGVDGYLQYYRLAA